MVFPEDSGPYTSMIRPRGKPPIPKATSSAMDPVGITSIGARPSSPSRMTDPLPNCRSICDRAVSRARSRSSDALTDVNGVLDFALFFAAIGFSSRLLVVSVVPCGR